MAATLINSQTLYNQLLYINKQSSHPPTITKQLTWIISRRISDTSCGKQYLDKAAPEYNNATKISDFYENTEFTSTIPPRRNRNKKIIWFNPPYSVHVKRNIGRIFLQLIDRHFPRHHNYRKLFNRNSIKICNSLHANMANVIRNHNTRLLKCPFPTDIKECICRWKPECPLDKNVFLNVKCTTLQLIGWVLTKLNTIMELARKTLKNLTTTHF